MLDLIGEDEDLVNNIWMRDEAHFHVSGFLNERVREAFERSPRRSAVRHATTLGITPRSVRRILHNDLHYHPYKIQIVQALNSRDYGARVTLLSGNAGPNRRRRRPCE